MIFKFILDNIFVSRKWYENYSDISKSGWYFVYYPGKHNKHLLANSAIYVIVDEFLGSNVHTACSTHATNNNIYIGYNRESDHCIYYGPIKVNKQNIKPPKKMVEKIRNENIIKHIVE